MAERRRLPSTEPQASLVSSSPPPPLKKSKFPNQEEEKEVIEDIDTEDSLEANERLSSASSSSQLDSNVKNITEESEPLPGPSDQLSVDFVDGISEVTSTTAPTRSTTTTTTRQRMGRNSGISAFINENTHYQEISLIGDGAYGTVYKAKDLTSGNVVALKKVRVPLTEDGLPTSTLREIAGLKQLERFEHPNIVRLLDVCQGNFNHQAMDNDNNDEQQQQRNRQTNRSLTLWLVFEHVERDLSSFISNCPRSGISRELVKQMSNDILLGVDFLHSNRIIHRDLKPQNLLVTRDGKVKIADFGLAKTYDFDMRLTSVVVTLWYRAPEVLLGCSYATPIDIWSVGCILAELNRLAPLFPGTSEGDQLDRIFQILGTPSRDEWPENVSVSWTAFPHRQGTPLRVVIPEIDDNGLHLITNMLTFDPHTRLTAAQALRHTYFLSES